jgi:hypothetical protein
MRKLKKGNNDKKRLACTALVRPTLEYGAVCWDPYREGAVCWDPYREGQISALNLVQKRATKFANNVKESGWETSAQRRLITRICTLYKAYTRGRAWEAIGNRLLKPCYLSRGDRNRIIRTRKQRTDVCKHSFVNRTMKS